MALIQTVLVGHHLAPGDNDGGTFIKNPEGSAHDFGTVDAARQYIKDEGLNEHKDGRHLDIWHVFILTEIPFD